MEESLETLSSPLFLGAAAVGYFFVILSYWSKARTRSHGMPKVAICGAYNYHEPVMKAYRKV